MANESVADSFSRAHSSVPPSNAMARAGFHVLAAAAFGLFVHAVFRSALLGGKLAVMSVGFLFVCPFAIGVLAAIPGRESPGWRSLVLAPWLACGLVAAVSAALGLEPALCVVMALPPLLVMSTLGGIACVACSRFLRRRPAYSVPALCAVLLAPFGVSYAEGQFPAPQAMRGVHTTVQIRANKEVIWQNITRVSEIRSFEQRFSIFHALGLPRPREALLSRDGVGAVREAIFAGNLDFVETVTHWEHEKDMRFTIEVDHSKSLPPLIQAIDGVYFTVLEGRYSIEPLADGSSRLHLRSVERLGTRFNWYAGLWTDGIMTHLQNYILRVVRERCEAESAASKARLASR